MSKLFQQIGIADESAEPGLDAQMDAIVLSSDEEKKIGQSARAIAEGEGPWGDAQGKKRFGQQIRLGAAWVQQGDAIFQCGGEQLFAGLDGLCHRRFVPQFSGVGGQVAHVAYDGIGGS